MENFKSVGNSRYKRIIFDVFLNIAGTAISLIVLQIFIYPLMARRISSDMYGEMQTSMSLVYLVGSVLGSSLSTTRLLKDMEYTDKGYNGDFNLINILCVGVVTIIGFIAFSLYLHTGTVVDIVLRVIICLSNYLISYLEVGFRLQLSYKRIFTDKLISCVGYVLGFGLFLLVPKWEWVFIVSYLLRIIYYLHYTRLINEPIIRTPYFKTTVKAFGSLGFATLLNKSLAYFDKLLLFPLLGGSAVSVYFAANIFGKMMIQILNPITNVMLSYLSRTEKIKDSIWKYTVILGGLFCFVTYWICMFISEPVLRVFYPQWADAALVLVPIATASLCVSSFYSIIYPLVLKSLKTNTQIIISGAGLVVYILISLLTYKPYGLMGCCVALLASYVIQLLISLCYILKNAKK